MNSQNENVQDWPSFDWLCNEAIDKESIPAEGVLCSIKRVSRVETRFKNQDGSTKTKTVVVSDKGDLWPPLSQIKKLVEWYGPNSKEWEGKVIRVKTMPVMVSGDEKKTLLFERAPTM